MHFKQDAGNPSTELGRKSIQNIVFGKKTIVRLYLSEKIISPPPPTLSKSTIEKRKQFYHEPTSQLG